MFGFCNSFTTLDLSCWDTKNISDMGSMFSCSTSLKTIRIVGCNEATINKIKAQLAKDGITGANIITQ